MEELAGQGVSKDQLPPWVGGRIKTTDPQTDPSKTPPNPPKDPPDPPLDPRKTGGTPQNPPKTPGYKAPDSEVPQDETDPPIWGGQGSVQGLVQGLATPPQPYPRGLRYPREEALKALNIIEAQGRGYMKATDRANGTIVMVPVDRARIPR